MSVQSLSTGNFSNFPLTQTHSDTALKSSATKDNLADSFEKNDKKERISKLKTIGLVVTGALTCVLGFLLLRTKKMTKFMKEDFAKEREYFEHEIIKFKNRFNESEANSEKILKKLEQVRKESNNKEDKILDLKDEISDLKKANGTLEKKNKEYLDLVNEYKEAYESVKSKLGK